MTLLDRLGAGRPRLGILLLAQEAQERQLADALRAIPRGVAERLDEIQVFAADDQAERVRQAVEASPLAGLACLGVRSDPRRYGYGGRRKIAFEYALEHGLDRFALADAKDAEPLDEVASLLCAALETRAQVVIASHRPAFGAVAAWMHNTILGLRIADWGSGLRVYDRDLLGRIPFQLNADDRGFDTEILIQCRALGGRVVERPSRGREGRGAARDFSPWRSLAAAIDYRLHQLHVTRRGRFLVNPDTAYSFKRSPHGSHVQILEAIRPGTRVLDLGCSQGLLAEHLVRRGARVSGVDREAPARVSSALESYYQRDLEEPLQLPEGRVFDYVIVSDVIEHVRNRTRLLRSVRRHLKPDGRLVISTPNIAIWFYRLSLLAGRFEYGPRGVLDETHVHLFTRATFRREVERSGFRILKERVTALPFEVVFESTGQSRLLRALSSAYHALARLWPQMFAYQFVLEAEVMTLHDRPVETGAP